MHIYSHWPERGIRLFHTLENNIDTLASLPQKKERGHTAISMAVIDVGGGEFMGE